MSVETVDVIVLGMGVAGEAVAGPLAEAGLAVVGIDARLIGGECAYWGCIPTKIIVRGSNLLAEARRAGVGASPVEARSDWERTHERVRSATADWDDTIAVRRFEDKGGRFVRGHGRFTAPDTVEVNGDSFRATRGVVIASGTSPAVPDIPGLDAVPFWTNRDAVATDSLPESIAVLGAGSVGAEFAQAWARFGTAVTLIETGDRLLANEEPEASALIAEVFRSEGIDVRTGTTIERVEGDDDHTLLHTSAGDIRAQQLMVATGRATNLRDLAAGLAGINDDAKTIEVDDHLRAAPGVWAVGDITGRGAFTHIATYQAKIAAADILGRPTEPAHYHAVPRVTFTDPEVGAVGMTEQQAADRGRRVQCVTTDVAKTSRGFVHGDDNRGLIKLVVDANDHRLLGATSVGPMGGEVLSMLTLAVHARITTDVLREMIYAYPTFHRGILDAVGKL
jgi:pyruvate/2-oxoglutarate dehydrogenase complex dihydrolipoamide dehydrogenase (E3) component